MNTCECDGSGAIRYEIPGDGIQRPLGHGYTIEIVTGSGTRLCECRKSLAPRDGEARWWTTETVYSGQWESTVFEHQATIKVDVEIPVSEDNYVLHRRGNRYYPTTIDLDFSIDWFHSLFPDEARELARLLNEAADAADAIDEPDADKCGHWYPCDCKNGTKEIDF